MIIQCMTSASELFSTRRSRSTRSDPDSLSVSSSLNRHHSHHHHNRRLNHRHDSCDPHRRGPPRLRRFCHLPERRADSEVESSNGFESDNRLPGSVLLARARLVERLRGVSLSSNRANRVSLGVDEQMELNSGVGFSFYANFQPEVSYDQSKKPQGLTQVAISCLHRETFSMADEMRDCSICLESFANGDVLISLPCRHSFHSSCLNPWLRACGDCPYCRRAIA